MADASASGAYRADVEQTESGVRVIAHGLDGSEVNITEGVMALYDLVISSMDWGSGFWTAEDAAPVAFVARTCGFPSVDEVDRYLAARQHEEQRRAFWKTIPEVVKAPWTPDPLVHEHVWSVVGRCMWPRCTASDNAPSQIKPPKTSKGSQETGESRG